MIQKIKFIAIILGIVISVVFVSNWTRLAVAFVSPSITETRITDVDSYSPKIYGNKVVWEDYRNGHADVYLADITDPDNIVETRVTTELHDHAGPSIYGNTVVWMDYRNGNWDIYMADITDPDNIIERSVTTNNYGQYNPAIYGNIVAWEDRRNGQGDIYMADISDPDNIIETRVATNYSTLNHPTVYGDRIVWEDVRSGNRDIYMADISDPAHIAETRITTNSGGQFYPSIYGNKIAWQDDRNGVADVYLANITDPEHIVESRLTESSSGKYAPIIYGNKILWVDDGDGSGDVYILDFTDLNNIVETHVTSDSYDQYWASLYDNKIVWTDWRNDPGGDTANIYMAQLVEPFNNFATTEKFQQDISTGFISIDGLDPTHVTAVTFENDYTIITYDAQVVIPAGTIMTKTGGGYFDFTEMMMEDITDNLRDSYSVNIAGATEIGISNLKLSFSKNITVTLSVGGAYNGETLNIYSVSAGENEWNLATTCEVSSGLCEFQTNHATMFSAGDDPSLVEGNIENNVVSTENDPSYTPIIAVGNHRIYLADSGKVNIISKSKFALRGRILELARGRAELYLNNHKSKRVKIGRKGKWRIPGKLKRGVTKSYQIKYFNSQNQEIETTPVYRIRFTK